MKTLLICRVDSKEQIKNIKTKINEISANFQGIECENEMNFDFFFYYNKASKSELENIKQTKGSQKMYFCNYDQFSISDISQKIVEIKENYYGYIVIEDVFSTDLAGLIGSSKNYKIMTNINEFSFNFKEEKLLFSKYVYNNNLKAEGTIEGNFCINLCGYKFKQKKENKENEENEEFVDLKIEKNEQIQQQNILQQQNQFKSDVLIAVGRGIKTKEEVTKIRELAKNKGYMFGVSRPVAMSGWAKISEIIGISGTIYSPKLCIAIGVSGSAAFSVGIENSDCIICINSDKKAPIVKMSDIALINSYKNTIDELFKYNLSNS